MTDEGGDGDMITKTETRELITDLFEEEALVIGGLVAVHEVEDDLVWRLLKSLDAIRLKTLCRIEEKDPGDGDKTPRKRHNLKPHPAVEEFLLGLRRT
jgi:hypothetical protein